MARPVFSLFDFFKIGETQESLHTIGGLTKLNPKTTKEVKKAYLLENKGWETQEVYGIEKAFEIEGEVTDDEGTIFLISKEDAQGEDAKAIFEFVDEKTKYTGTVVVDITTAGGNANDLITFSGTLYVYGKPTKEIVEG